MRDYRFDPGLLARREADPTFDPYRAAGELLRDFLGGGDIFAEVRERIRRDPQFRAMISNLGELLADAANGPLPARGRRQWARHGRRPR